LLDDVVDMDFRHVHAYGNVTPTGGKVTIAQDGWLVVGRFDKPVAVGEVIYYDKHGRMTTDPTNNTQIGTALSSNDEDGFAKMRIDLYVNREARLPTPLHDKS
jgi:hypothetical protein